ncbi:MAG: hypothetical protein ACYDBH_14220 [Acidobacteriaceae bacterium]
MSVAFASPCFEHAAMNVPSAIRIRIFRIGVFGLQNFPCHAKALPIVGWHKACPAYVRRLTEVHGQNPSKPFFDLLREIEFDRGKTRSRSHLLAGDCFGKPASPSADFFRRKDANRDFGTVSKTRYYSALLAL